MSNTVDTSEVKIICAVTTQVRLGDDETPATLNQRYADIYLHDAGENGHHNKKDLGANTTFFLKPTEKQVLLDESLAKALVSVAKEMTDLEGVYNDDESTFHSWEEVEQQLARTL